MSSGPFRFLTDCMSSDGDLINDQVTEVSYRTMRRRCGDLQEVARSLGYDRWLTLESDPYVSYNRSWYGGVPCYYFVWSGIEQVFTPGGVSPWEWKRLSDRGRRQLLPNWKARRNR